MEIKKRKTYTVAVLVLMVVILGVLVFMLLYGQENSHLNDLNKNNSKPNTVEETQKDLKVKSSGDNNSTNYDYGENFQGDKYNTNNETIQGQKEHNNKQFKIPEDEL